MGRARSSSPQCGRWMTSLPCALLLQSSYNPLVVLLQFLTHKVHLPSSILAWKSVCLYNIPSHHVYHSQQWAVCHRRRTWTLSTGRTCNFMQNCGTNFFSSPTKILCYSSFSLHSFLLCGSWTKSYNNMPSNS